MNTIRVLQKVNEVDVAVDERHGRSGVLGIEGCHLIVSRSHVLSVAASDKARGLPAAATSAVIVPAKAPIGRYVYRTTTPRNDH